MGSTVQGTNSSRGTRYLLSPKCPNQTWGPPASYSIGSRALSQQEGEFQQLGQEFKHSLPSSAKVKNEWSHISFAPYAFMVWREKFTFFFFTVYQGNIINFLLSILKSFLLFMFFEILNSKKLIFLLNLRNVEETWLIRKINCSSCRT